MKRDSYVRAGITILILVAALVSWSQFLWPPVAAFSRSAGNPDFVALTWKLLNPVSDIYPYFGGGWLLLACALAVVLILLGWARKFLNYLDRSGVGISVLEMKMELLLNNASGSDATVTRSQAFHANRRGIKAYSLVYRPDSLLGRVDRSSLLLTSQINGKNITLDLLRRGTEKSFEVKEMYNRDLPVNWLATYLPNWLVLSLWRLGAFRGTVVERNGAVRYHDEYTGPEAIISLNATMRPVTNVVLKVTFPEDAAPQPADIKAFLLREIAVESVALKRSQTPGRVSYEAEVRSLFQATMQIQWNNRPVPPPPVPAPRARRRNAAGSPP